VTAEAKVINGAFFFDRRPMHDIAATVRDGLRTICDGDVEVVCEPGIAMARAAAPLWTNGVRSASNAAPSGRLIAFDGRIDNRDDLLLRLGGNLADRSDESIALATFRRFGVDGLVHLIGEWSVAMWDAQALHLARDYIGTRPLYYAAGPRSVMWSSSLGELALRSGRANALSEDFIAGAVVQEISPDITPYHGIHAVPPGVCVSFAADRQGTRRRFWSFGPGVVRFRRVEEYDEAFRDLWLDAVRVRLRTTQPIWAELSGGIDSSSVVCTADVLMRAGRVDARSMGLISHATFDSPEGDERRFIAEVESRVGIRSDVFGVEEHRDLVDEEWDWVSPFAARGVLLACLRHVRRHDGRIVLSGRMGDAVTGCQPDNSLAVFDDFEVDGAMAALASMRRWSRAIRQPILHIGWRAMRSLAGSGPVERSRSGVRPGTVKAALLTPRLQLAAEKCRAAADPLTTIRPAKRWLARMLLGYARTSRLDLPLHPPGVTYTYPFAHRPLVEFMLAIPGSIVTAPGETRSLMRRALAGIVPPRVIERQSKGYYPPAALRTLRPLASRMQPVTRLEIVRRGWVDPAALDAALRAFADAGVASSDLRRVIRLEQWLASRTSAMPRRKEVRSHGVHHA
jgi:asparagine synthase (glutamine-hydrolysing)